MQDKALQSGLRLPYRVIFADKADSYDAKMRERYFSFWDQMPVNPEDVVAALCEGIVGGEDDLVIRDVFLDPIIENNIATGLRVETKFVPRRDLEGGYGYAYLNNDREYDFTTGTCMNGDIRTSGLSQKGLGRIAVRNALQLGYTLGCSKIDLSATRIGCLLWLQHDAYDVTNVNPKYLDKIQKRWDKIKDYCPETVDKSGMELAIKAGDLRAIAASEVDIGSALGRSGNGRDAYHEMSLESGAIPLNRFLLIDVMIDCWQGHADMDNLEQRSRLSNLLGGWTLEAFEPKASFSGYNNNYTDHPSL